MQTIDTTYHGPTNHRNARITVRSSSGAHTYSCTWNDHLDVNDNHVCAALYLANRLGWTGTWVGGEKRDKTGTVFVWVSFDNIKSHINRSDAVFYVASKEKHTF